MTAFYATAILALGAGPPEGVERPTVLVLDDFKLIEGQVTEIPDFHDATGETKLYRVASGGELRTLPAKAVLFTGGTRQEAYRFVKSKWAPATADRHLKLAEWCRDNGLVVEALAEAKAGASLSGPDPYLAKLIRELEAARTAERAVRIVRPAATTPAKHVAPVPPKAEKPSVDPAVEKAFGLKVQPILMNQCVACHADGTKGKFTLSRVAEGEATGSATTVNLVAALAQVRADEPGRSPLLSFATTPHGGQSQAVLTVRHPAYQHLSAWVAAAAARMPRPAVAKAVPFAAGPTTPSPPAPPKNQPVTDPTPTDPFDPAAFNKSAPLVKKP